MGATGNTTATASTASAPRIAAADHHLTRAGADHGKLEVRWRFENPTARTLYVLIRRPLTVAEGDPVVLDHSASDQPLSSEANAESPPTFVELAAHTSSEYPASYQLVLRPNVTALRVVGRFGYSDVPPDPSWRQHPSWGPMRKWQRLVDSAAFAAAVQ